jgi:hypothetical protein
MEVTISGYIYLGNTRVHACMYVCVIFMELAGTVRSVNSIINFFTNKFTLNTNDYL